MKTKAKSNTFRDRHAAALRFRKGGRCDFKPEVRVAVQMAVSVIAGEWIRKMEALDMSERHPELALRIAEERRACAQAVGLLRQIARRFNQTFDAERMEAIESTFVPANEME